MQKSIVWIASLMVASAATAGHWRGPSQNGSFPGTGLPERWSPEGANLLWKAEAGSRSAPLVMDGRVFLINRAGEDECLQERVMALNEVMQSDRMAERHDLSERGWTPPPREDAVR